MAPSRDPCEGCKKAFFGKQKFITCCGPCGTRFHLDCAKITEEDYNFLISSGVSTYKCESCVVNTRRERDDDTPVKSSTPTSRIRISPERELILPEQQRDDIHGVQLETIRLNGVATMEMVHSLCDAVSKLTKEITFLKSEKAAIKCQLGELIASKSASVTSRASPAPSTSYAAKASQRAPTKPTSSDTSSHRTTHRVKSSLTDSIDPPHTPKSPEVTADGGDDGFTLVSRRKKRTTIKTDPVIPSTKKRIHLIGVRNSSSIPMAKPQPKKKSLFISRFDPSVES